jgi:hypothetical protein
VLLVGVDASAVSAACCIEKRQQVADKDMYLYVACAEPVAVGSAYWQDAGLPCDEATAGAG